MGTLAAASGTLRQIHDNHSIIKIMVQTKCDRESGEYGQIKPVLGPSS